MKIKKGDKVKLISGKDKGKTGKVLQVFPLRERVSVEGRNLLIKHMRPRKQGEKGQRIEFPAPMALSNVILICPQCGKPTRIGYKTVQSNAAPGSATPKAKSKKYRICQKCKQVI